MIFSSLEYILFFLLILALMILVKKNKIKKAILLVASYYFYAYWDYRFVLLMFIMSIVNYYIGLRIESTIHAVTRKRWLIVSVIFNLVILGFFKYFNFFIDSANIMLASLDVQLPLLEIILPVGISFITFEVMSYTIDIYKKNNTSPSFWDLSLLVAFFPHLIAGPILKPREFLPQLQRDIVIRWKNVEAGLQIFILGLVKKILIADRLALFVDPVFNSPEKYSSTTIWLAVIAYAIQIYCDFSGYSDMAIGSAKCLGIEIPKNFNMPYISKNVTEFWRRWHISLSTWLKEYLYISLGGNRKGKMRQYANLFIVMLLGGLWHGASWNFVLWGALHGVGLAVHKIYMDYIIRGRTINSYFYNFVSWLVTLIFVIIAWVFFRSVDFSTSLLIVEKMLFLHETTGTDWYALSLFIVIPILILSHFVGNRLGNHLYLPLNSFKGLFLLFFILLGLLLLAPVSSSPFIYFQF